MTILEHQLGNLSECGIKEVVLVVGYLANQIFQKLEENNFDLKLKFIRNPIYYKTNTVYSLWLARNELQEDIIYLIGDVVFHRNILLRLINSEQDTCLAVRKGNVGEEEVKVKVESGIVKAIGKEILPKNAYGEFIGIAKFSQKFNVLLVEKLNEVVKEGAINAFFEAALNRTLESYAVYAIDISDLPCTEVDTLDDLNLAKKIYSLMFREGGRKYNG
jgi:phosphoenolpyruvate phosphomutase